MTYILLLTAIIQLILFIACVFSVLSVQRRNYELTIAVRRMEIRILHLERRYQREGRIN